MSEAGPMVPLSPDYRLDQRSRLARSLPEKGKGTAATGSRQAARRKSTPVIEGGKVAGPERAPKRLTAAPDQPPYGLQELRRT